MQIQEEVTRSYEPGVASKADDVEGKSKRICEREGYMNARIKPILNQELFDMKYGYKRIDLTLGQRVYWHFRQMGKSNSKEWFSFLLDRVPLLRWITRYDWEDCAFYDIVGGIMISVISVPQCLAYAFLVGVPANYGLITGFISPLIYTVFGTSKHTSAGPFAIVSLMVGSVVSSELSNHHVYELYSLRNSSSEWLCCSEYQPLVNPLEAVNVACQLTFLIGLIQLLFGLLNVGLLAVWLSDHLVQGLTSGAAIHVLTSQLKYMTGIYNVPSNSEPLGIIKFYMCFISQWNQFDTSCLMISSITIALLLSSSFLIDPWLKRTFNIKFPMELCVVVASSVVVWLTQQTIYQIDVPHVGQVDSGLVSPRFPSFIKFPTYVSSAISIAVISFVIHIALAKLVSKKLHYEINANQEWLALGAMHTISSFFGCFAGGSSLGRTMLQVKFGTRSQISTVVCAIIMLGFIYGASCLIFYLPKAVLASIVVVALKDLFIQLVQAFQIHKESTVDFLIYIVTLASVILVNVNYGLLIGIIFAMLSVVFRSQWAEGSCLGRIPGTSHFKGLTHYREATEIKGIKIFRFNAPIYFANAEFFTSSLHSACGVNPIMVQEKLTETLDKHTQKAKSAVKADSEKMGSCESSDELWKLIDHTILPDLELKIHEKKKKNKCEPVDEEETELLTHVIIDCSTVAYIDLMGKDSLVQTYREYEAINIKVFFSQCRIAVRQQFEHSNFYEHVPKKNMFVSNDEAVAYAQREQNILKRSSSAVEACKHRSVLSEDATQSI